MGSSPAFDWTAVCWKGILAFDFDLKPAMLPSRAAGRVLLRREAMASS